ncbi:putative tRNA intron endonuclease [Ancylostoma caninum]|uniref:tRNA-intron lyase n=1 Tax=Ancylostoma caninum TaxID=29170 RepID=A0A368FRX6_ANCCA|nr:putative tRNA intron endonuclease [Ancylostoma caninum]
MKRFDVSLLQNNWRIIAQTAVGSEKQPPYFLSPEQVTVLVLYGAIRVREPVNTSPELQANLIPAKEATGSTNTTKPGENSAESTDAAIPKDEQGTVEFKKIELNENQYRWLEDFEVPVPCTRDHRAREVVFHDLWRKGYYSTSGEQYGCAYLDFLVKLSICSISAKYLLDYVMEEEGLAVAHVISLVRVATQVKKNLSLAVVASDTHHPHYLTFDWFKPYSKEFEI